MHSSVIEHKSEINNQKYKTYHKHKRREDAKPHNVLRNKDTHKKKSHRKKRIELKVVSGSSDESDDEYRNKRRKLADAVVVRRQSNNDQSSLQDRIQKMLHGTIEKKWNFGINDGTVIEQMKHPLTVDKQTETDIEPIVEPIVVSILPPLQPDNASNISDKLLEPELHNEEQKRKSSECIVISTDDDDSQHKNDKTELKTNDIAIIGETIESQDVVDSHTKKKCNETSKKEETLDSDEDLELLRQHALKTKAAKAKPTESIPEPEKPLSEDEDSDTAELRIICLKSALLKKAIEMKRKQKLRKRLSQSSITDDLLNEQIGLGIESNNNTDIESVDMDIGSDGEEKSKDATNDNIQSKEQGTVLNGITAKDITTFAEDELDEDEDLLRAKLLTSLSKNLPNLVNPNVVDSIEERRADKLQKQDKTEEKSAPTTKPQVKLPENRFVINLGESDSEGEHEATKNLTKMHIKLSEPIDFQEKLDMFLKATRREVEKSNLPDVVEPALPKTPQKYVAKVRPVILYNNFLFFSSICVEHNNNIVLDCYTLAEI